ncbi:MAG: sensor histidine kinase [Alicyclobacillus sp.]|nr:sensor histidine kinase [Alicyclobacillus sp.]
MAPKVSALKQALEQTLSVVVDTRDQVASIVRGTQAEVQRLETEFSDLQRACLQAIARVEALEAELRRAREQLMCVNREVGRHSEQEMRAAYEAAQQALVALADWRDREKQLRLRREDVSRRLKSLQATAHEAEILWLKLGQVSGFLNAEFGNLSASIEAMHVESLLGVRLLQMQEDERRWLAQALHDGPMQSLASAAMRIHADPGGAGTQDEVRQRLSEVLNELREMVFELRPPLLDDLGLVPTLRRYLDQWSKSFSRSAKLRLVGLEKHLSTTETVTVFRGVQEALRNVVKHAQADEVDLTITYGDDFVQVDVSDNGLGIREVDWLGWVESGRLGLSLCRQRLSILGGRLDVGTRSPRGTRVEIHLPIARGIA